MRPTILALALALTSCGGSTPPPAQLDLYFIDVEGGQATLIITPAGETLLVDAGFPGTGGFASQPGDPATARDPQRILEVAKLAGVTRIDYLLVTHFHADHVGGVPELSHLIPIDTFVDHGGVTEDADRVAGTKAIHAAYVAVREAGRHLEPTPGDRLPLVEVDVTVVSTAGATLTSPLDDARSAPTASCLTAGIPAQESTENPRSTGFLLQFGRFRFLDVGDLTGEPLHQLSCPSDRLGPVDVYLVSHHGGADAAGPSIFSAIRPRVAILNNGATKGGAAPTLKTLQAIASTETWQLHRSEATGAENAAAERIANLDTSTAHWIKISAYEDGSFVVTNPRTGATTQYPAR
ncbi:MAG: MBL fold metallo-hydrolase [Acidobacteria bacterium]|nr:MBL fold metallo-hydrolase [Acidobacteriota bacterium]